MPEYRDQLIRHYKQVRERLHGKRPPPQQRPPAPPPPAPEPPAPPPEPLGIVSAHAIMRATGKVVGVPYEELRSKRRTQDIVEPRQIALYLCRQMLPDGKSNTWTRLGRKFDLDHSTVLWAIRSTEHRMLDPDYASRVQKIACEVRAILGTKATMEQDNGEERQQHGDRHQSAERR